MQRSTLVLATTAVLLLNKPALPQEAHPASLPARFVSLPLGPHGPLGAARDSAVQAVFSPSIPMWNGTISGFNYSMVGQNPQLPLTSQTTFVVTPVIPIALTFADGTTFDPTATDACLGGNNAAGLTVTSPLFGNYNFMAGSTNVGAATQYTDFYQRSNFWQYTNPAGMNPNYHVLLSPSQPAAVRISVPAASGRVITGSYCGGKFGEIDISWFDTYIHDTVFPQLASLGVLPSNFPVFLLQNVFQYEGTPANCCILGYHSAFYNSSFGNAIQTYAVASFDSSGAYGMYFRDVAALSHEVGEWMDDPMGTNPTPPWGNIGQVSGCQSDLENGDPLTGTAPLTATMANGFTYHLQELAFFSWFYNQTPSLGVNGWYSSNGSFRSPALPCGSTGTGTATASLNVSSLSFSSRSVGTSGSPLFITLTNTGTAVLSGIGVSLAGINPGDFAFTNNCPTSLAAGMSCTVPVTFLPTAAGVRSATVSFADSVAGSPQTVALTGTGAGTLQVWLSSGSFGFANQNTGTISSPQGITLTNIGTAAVSIFGITMVGANPGEFAQTNACPVSLAANTSCALSVTFRPTVAGPRSAMINIVDNVTGSPQTVTLTGTGAGTLQISLGASNLSFANQNIGTTSSAQGITLTNIGTASVSISGITIVGGNPGDFAQTNACPASLAANSNCALLITFKPTLAGARSATVSIADNVTGSPQTVALTGTGTGTPQVSLSVNNLSFAVQNAGTTSLAQGITLTNIGTAALSISGITMLGSNPGDFIQTNACPASLAANTSCAVSVTFQPTTSGARSATVNFADNAGNPQTVGLTGTGASSGGTPQVALSASSLTFGSQSVGTGASQSLTLSNIGTGPLSGIAILMAGVNAADFSQSNNCPSSLASNTSCSVTITFKPSIAGIRSASINISDNAAVSPQTIGLIGTGLAAPALAPWINSISPFVIPMNQTSTLVVNGFNFQSGFTATLTTSAGTVPIANAALTFISASQIQLKVTPGGSWPYVATITITNPGGFHTSSQFVVSLY